MNGDHPALAKSSFRVGPDTGGLLIPGRPHRLNFNDWRLSPGLCVSGGRRPCFLTRALSCMQCSHGTCYVCQRPCRYITKLFWNSPSNRHTMQEGNTTEISRDETMMAMCFVTTSIYFSFHITNYSAARIHNTPKNGTRDYEGRCFTCTHSNWCTDN